MILNVVEIKTEINKPRANLNDTISGRK